VSADASSEFADAFTAHYPGVLAFATRRVGESDGEDVAAEVFARAWNAWHKAPRQAIRPWLFGIAHNLVVDTYRAKERRDRLQTRMSAQRPSAPDDQLRLTEASVDIARAWQQLSLSDRETLALVAWDGLSQAEASALLGCNRATYSVRLSRARKRLTSLLETTPNPAPSEGSSR